MKNYITGDRVRVIWSGRIGTVINPRHRIDDRVTALVALDPFVPNWRGARRPIMVELICGFREIRPHIEVHNV